MSKDNEFDSLKLWMLVTEVLIGGVDVEPPPLDNSDVAVVEVPMLPAIRTPRPTTATSTMTRTAATLTEIALFGNPRLQPSLEYSMDERSISN